MDFDGWSSIDLIDTVLALLVEPVLGYPKEYDKLMESLNAPFEGTEESKQKAHADMLAQFGLTVDDIRSGVRGKLDKSKKKKKRRTAKRFGDPDDAKQKTWSDRSDAASDD